MASELERKEAFLKVWFDAPENIHWAHGMSNGVEKDISDTFDRAIAAWNTRPAPAATDTGLVRYSLTTWSEEPRHYSHIEADPTGEYVRFDQAEELLAAERAEKRIWMEKAAIEAERVERLEADNAALAARIKELEASRNEMDNIAYAAGFYQAECNLPEHENAQEALKEYRGLKTLAAKLSAAEKVREAAIELDEAISDDFNIFGAQQKLRAALGGKP
ncbi:hypothetical protein [Brucella anthropi]|uniref:hypothetical protein n=1 Tax=Brucella anthropi TaxID=529 RepID=UPI003209DA82